MEITTRKMRFFNQRNLDSLPQVHVLSDEERFAIKVVAHVYPFRVNNYVAEQLIDWDRVPDDPIYRLTFPQKGMLRPKQFEEMASVVRRGDRDEIAAAANRIRWQLNPHPAGQMTNNVPTLEGQTVPGLQHKYRETCLVFPSSGQTCHAYCTFCFRWPQFVGQQELKFATDAKNSFLEYLRLHTEVTDVLFTGGDPMIMSARKLAAYIEPLLEPEFRHIQNIRIGTKSLAYWPYRFVTDSDTDDLLRLFEKIVNAGKHLAIMGHFSHWKELSTDVVQEAIDRIRGTGAVIRTQSPLIRHINDDPEVWARMWKEQVRLGCVPYYMFVERDTGAQHYFSVPLFRAWQIFQQAYQSVSGLSRTVRGPCMSAHPGKVMVSGISEIHGEKVFVLRFLQARVPGLVQRPFFAKFDPEAAWLTDLEPALGRQRFIFEEALERKAQPLRTNGHSTGVGTAGLSQV